ncbi:MAG: VWA domain-containing protein [Rhodocyclaceae bacterium]|nr:VWA domain-containing protein [Rhodocyclaceae bacterium]MBX3668675.1 VWA domain-containing protein [Rhodocyclaceae bacterium]
MEEFIGGLWHKFITRAATRSYPQAAVRLDEIERMAGVLFRALGGDPGLRVAAAADETHGARRRWLARIAHTDDTLAPARRDEETLRLPPEIALFPERSANRDLYLWLIAQAAALQAPSAENWIVHCQQAALATLTRYPGLAARYRRLVDAVIAARIPPERLPAAEAAVEREIRRALLEPGSVSELPPARRPPQPVPLWLYPSEAARAEAAAADPPADQRESAAPRPQDESRRRHKARRTPMAKPASPFLMQFRAESLLSFGEYVKVDRAQDEDADPEAGKIADQMDELAIARDARQVASKVRFDLDLPSAAVDDIPLASGILLPEWDWKKGLLKKDQCCLTELAARDAIPAPLPQRLAAPAHKLRRQFEALAPGRRWLKNQPQGSEPDLDACVRALADRRAGWRAADLASYLACERRERDMACLVLADLSMSTDAWVGDTARVIDVIQDSLLLFSEALGATGDRFALHGFSSRRRDHVRYYRIKDFDEPHNDLVRGRIAALRPGFYTRMGAAIRHATSMLARQRSALRLLLILSDGKPNDLDHYEGRYGIEDTRMSILEARKAGLKPFCVTIDVEGAGYLPHLFGVDGYTVVRKPAELPLRLPLLYSRLTDT